MAGRLHRLTTQDWRTAAEVAIACRLRGGDAAYVALAARCGDELVTWDNSMLTRGSALVRTATPDQWLSANEDRRDTA